MPADPFIQRWQNSAAPERANYQLFLSELCDYIEVPRPNPAGADDRENNYVFERPVTFRHPTGLTSTGFIDLYKRGKQQQPAILAALCDAVSMALRRRQELPAQGTDAKSGHRRRPPP